MALNARTLWDIPELRIHLAQFLDDAQLAVASAVCKSWNTTFIPILYSQIIWNESSIGRKPSKKAVQTHATHIRTLDILGFVREFPFGDSTNIEDLYLGYGSIDHRIWDQLLKLIYNNPGLRSVNIDLLTDQYIYHREIMEALCHCKNLRTLSITLETLDVDMAEYLFNACSRLEDLTLDILKFTGMESMDKWTEFPNIRILSLMVEDGLSSRQQLQIIRKCPQLRSLFWHFSFKDVTCKEVCEAFSTYCLDLRELSLSSPDSSDLVGIQDKHLSQVICCCRELSKFVISDMQFGPLSFQSLRPHFKSLRNLVLDRNPLLSGSMAREIMTSCPLLDALSIVSLKAKDVLGVVQGESGVINIEGLTLHHPHPQDWICLNLTSLTVYICGLESKPSEWQRSVLKQLARLEKLELLDIGPDVPWGEMVQDGLDLRLASGLDILVTLKRLETIMFLRLRQQMEEQDVKWMIQAWPRLRNIHGKLHYNSSRNKWLKAILRKKHISTIEDDVYEDDE
ncbi:hypothetical protein BGZ79_006268 [Entomortierella chlamydospora]|nr:hypothetical protein BGZ79_006268 [Entomortierella chlamydospora]